MKDILPTVDPSTRDDPAFKAEEAVSSKNLTDQAKAIYPFFKPAASTLSTKVNVLLLLLLCFILI